jgi:hypothetical protein
VFCENGITTPRTKQNDRRCWLFGPSNPAAISTADLVGKSGKKRTAPSTRCLFKFGQSYTNGPGHLDDLDGR